ncbi:MAG: PAS domain-containing sensor histidine kinase, partial [Mesorhizobium sp.]
MAKADAWSAPGGTAFERCGGLAGNTRLIAQPAYQRLLAAEPFLRRLIPALIILFLVVIAAVRCVSLMNWHDDVDRSAKALLTLAAGQLASADDLAASNETAQELLETVGRQAAMAPGHVLVITDGKFKITAVTPRSTGWYGRNLDSIVSGGQPLFLFGEKAGILEVKVNGQDWYAAVALQDGGAAAAALVPQDAVFA